MTRSDPSRRADGPPVLELDNLPAFDGVALADPVSVRRASGAAIGLPGDLVLLIGAEAQTATYAIDADAASQLAGLVLAPELLAAHPELAEPARARGVRLYALPDEVTWAEAHRALTAVISSRTELLTADDDLAGLAQTIATLTGGLVSIEDTAARVLAYSRSSDDVDDLRRLSILGRSGPADYLDLLRHWGVYDRLAASEEVVEIDEHPESGVQRRLAVGVFAGRRQLGTIWVQQGVQEFGPHAKQALLGAARLTAAHLVDRQSRSRAVHNAPESGIDAAALLSGRSGRASVVDRRIADRPCVVVVFDTATPSSDRPAHQLLLDSLVGVITVHAAALRRNATTALLDDRAYLLLPSVDSPAAVRRVATAVVDAASRHLNLAILAAIGPIVDRTDAAQRSRVGADLALAAARRGAAAGATVAARAAGGVITTSDVTEFDSVRPSLAVEAAVEALAQQGELHDPRVDQLVRSDVEAARTLLSYLDSGSHAQAVADELQVHVTTVRYRLRKAESALGIHLDSPDERLAAQLQLRFVLHPAPAQG